MRRPCSVRRLLTPPAATLALLAGCAGPTREAAAATDALDTVGVEDERLAWWSDARFGLFLHWGLYAIPAGKWGAEDDHAEWILTTAEIPVSEYERFAERFDPQAFDAERWVALAKQAGMRYVVITTKHHDGFALFDSQVSDYDVMATPFRRDILRELADACRAAGLQMGWYHSIMDWHHPDYLPRREWEARSAEGADFARYVDYLHGQVAELLTNYGPIGVMWFDGEWESTWTHEHGRELYALCRRLQPDVLINNRVDKGRGGMAGLTTDARYLGDFGTPEQEIPATGLPGVAWETCMTMNDHWGWNAADRQWKSTEDLVRKLCDIASKGGNFLLNVGPTAAGEFPPEAVARLEEIGRWMEVNAAAIHGTEASPLPELPWGRCTRARAGARTRLYLHVFNWPADGTLVVPNLGSEPAAAYLLAEPERALAVTRGAGDVRIALPAAMPDPLATVVVLEVEGEPLVYETPRIEVPGAEFVHPLTVRLEAGGGELEIRYTLDGSEPVPTAPRYAAPFTVGETCLVRARSFHGGRPVSAIAEQLLRRVEPAPGLTLEPAPELFCTNPSGNRGCLDDSGLGLSCEVHSGDWSRLPDFALLPPSADESVAAVALPPGPAVEHVARRYAGYLAIERADVYTFALVSDDGARLWLDGRLVVDNDGLHGPLERRGQAALGQGLHALEVQWFNKTGGAELELSMAALGGAPAPIGPGVLRRAVARAASSQVGTPDQDELRLPALFSDGMVLQRDRQAPLWGQAAPGAEVSVRASWSGATLVTRADSAGRWRLTLPTPEAGGPHTLTVASGTAARTLSDVWSGEVWLASGQSNMEWPIAACAHAIPDYEAQRAAIDLPRLRLFEVQNAIDVQPRDDVGGSWKACTPETWPAFSAVGFYFGAELLRELDVPIGVIAADWGGTAAESWTSAAALRSAEFPELQDFLEPLRRVDEAVARGTPPDESWFHANTPSALFNGMIAPLVPYALRGAIWYQGESNVGRAAQYRRLFPTLIGDWRARWGIGDFPFLFVQIAPFGYQGDTGQAAELREAQAASLSVPNTGMAVTLDIGDARDIHPGNKWDVGRRLARHALAATYGRAGLVASGPTLRGLAVEGEQVRLTFDHVDGGLSLRGTPALTIAGADRVFHPAEAALEEGTLVVWSVDVPAPLAVRYAWGAADAASLFNGAGLPAGPFRTDDWE